MIHLFLAMAGGAIGAGLRYLTGRAATALFGTDLPWGTLFVNLSGGLLMGMLAAAVLRLEAGETWRVFLGVGVLGGFTTFSAFSLEVMTMLQRGDWSLAVGYAVVSVIGSVAALGLGLGLVRGMA
ncbi:fluoride efflux transporter CrcB [Sphingomonas sp. FW199]|uniref:fluoride efflux transporter CrcB n=1 Tax=Sphingomonas sp. FW199 TaxID=3400217 RepID=UPI003CE8BED5